MASLSIVTPVRGRHSMIPALIECYSRFTCIDGAEWLVLDNSEEPHELPGFIRHVYVGSKPYSIGAMRNACAAIAQGDVIAHMDSDDYYAPGYMAESLEFLLASGKQVAGCHCILFWDCKVKQGYRYDAQLKPYACGASMIYFKEWQRAHPFSNLAIGEDTQFCNIARAAGELASRSTDQLIARRDHGEGNTVAHALAEPEFRPVGLDADWSVPRADRSVCFVSD